MLPLAASADGGMRHRIGGELPLRAAFVPGNGARLPRAVVVPGHGAAARTTLHSF